MLPIYLRVRRAPDFGQELRITTDTLQQGTREGLDIGIRAAKDMAVRLSIDRVKRYASAPDSFLDKWTTRTYIRGRRTGAVLENTSKHGALIEKGRPPGRKAAPKRMWRKYLIDRKIISPTGQTRRDQNIIKAVQKAHALRGQPPKHILKDVIAAMQSSGKIRQEVINGQRRALRRRGKMR